MSDDVIVDGELLLHRFDTADENQFVIDEGTGALSATSAAFTFHDATGETPIGCSMYRDEVLITANLERAATRKRDTHQLVSSSVGKVRLVERNGDKHLDTVPDPWPDAPDQSFEADVAHALVTLPNDTSKSARRKWTQPLARAFEPISLSRD